MSETTQTTKLHSIRFSPDVLAKISPELSLQRHLSIGLRSNLRKFEEFKNVSLKETGTGRYDDDNNNNSCILGSSIVKSGSTTIICSISASLIEDELKSINDYSFKLDHDIISNDLQETINEDDDNSFESVYVTVKTHSGNGSKIPTLNEQNISQQLYDTIKHSKLIPSKSLKVNLGYLSNDEPTTTSTTTTTGGKKKFKFILRGDIEVWSCVGPIFDLCYASLIKSLKCVKLPLVYINEGLNDINTTSTTTSTAKRDLLSDSKIHYDLKLNTGKIGWCVTYGIVDIDSSVVNNTSDDDAMDVDDCKKSVLLADLEGESEDSIEKRMTVVRTKDGNLSQISICTDGGFKITKEIITRGLELSKRRCSDMINKY
ncbi:hypothetical protein CANARDRAFT_230588 [[Candida] arabinofermentans NRRL YB-2248]|uniref:Ribosomal RNA-processing protein 43 n=1 Tax=[Candida] arabinofermentans NRRL YB-2248 TaxID=983967 RepID=A0A1E4T4M2_9ASCO|nr:hypothetical protein CANARDRAFT_230588 [[Candida] arabinofermentans NRRL YB-2248]